MAASETWQCQGVKETLQKYRSGFTIGDAKRECAASTRDKYSVGIASNGGCLDTLSAIRAGMHPIWGCEIDDKNRKMFKDLTGAICYEDARLVAKNIHKIRVPTVLHTSFDCKDYSSLGSLKGAEGERGGEMYVWQGKNLICKMGPEVVLIEMTANVVNVNGGKDLSRLIRDLEAQYIVHHKYISVWRHGDPTNRKRLFIVAVHKRHGLKAAQFKFPKEQFDEEWYPVAADVAIPDDQVPARYVLKGTPKKVYAKDPKPGRMHHVARFGDGPGDREAPNAVQSHQGLAATQLTSNGCSRRTMLSWRRGDKIAKTRLTTPQETVRFASLDASYEAWARKFEDTDEFVQKCVNNGIPMATCHALDTCIVEFLEYLGVAKDVPATDDSATVARAKFNAKQRDQRRSQGISDDVRRQYGHVHSMLVDTGAQISCSHEWMGAHLKGWRRSNKRVGTASKDAQVMRGQREGKAQVTALNTAGHRDMPMASPMEYSTTTFAKGTLDQQLFSFQDHYEQGWSMHIRQPEDPRGSGMIRPADDGQPEQKIPFRYDWQERGGWYIDYVMQDAAKAETSKAYATLLEVERQRCEESNSLTARKNLQQNSYTPTAASAVIERLLVHPGVKNIKVTGRMKSRRLRGLPAKYKGLGRHTGAKPRPKVRRRGSETGQVDDKDIADIICGECASTEEHFVARHPGEKETRGTRMGLPHGVAKMKHMTFHRSRGHCGNADDCDICKYVKGCMRRITKKVDPHRETRPGHTIHMDMIVFSHRSVERSKYMVVMTDEATGWCKYIYLYLKSEAPERIREAIEDLRADPDFNTWPYNFVQVIKTDEAGEWGLKSKKWKQVQKDLKLKTIYRTPETSKELGRGEKSNSTAEIMIKSIMMEENLPQDHWQAAARGAEFLLNRFPNIATDVTASIDGDRKRPLELVTNSKYSRRQIDRELAYFVQPGRVALVHLEKVKGSSLQPKVRYGVAWGMYREQVIWKCPFTGSEFRSKSFSAMELSNSMNYLQFLNIEHKLKDLTKGELHIENRHENVDIQLQPPRLPGEKLKIPVIQVQTADETGVVREYVTDTAVGGNGNRAQVYPSNELGGHHRVFSPMGEPMERGERGILHESEGGAVLRRGG